MRVGVVKRRSKTMAEAEAAGETKTEEGATSDAPKDIKHESNCIFCRIASKKTPAEVLYEDTEYVCFVDHRPASTHHYLVIPRQHIKDAHSLTADHVPLIERMTEIAMQVIREKGGNCEECRMGFHWPPFLFVKHLHLHIVGPESSMGWLNRSIVFRKDSFAFYSPTKMIEYVRNKM